MDVEKQDELIEVSEASRDADGPAGATVSGSNPDPESVVLGMEQWAVIRQRRQAGESVSQIARELDLDRKTVRRCLKQP